MEGSTEQFALSNQESKSLIKIIKKYSNWFKGLYHVNPSIAADFRKKQEYYFNLKGSTGNNHSGCCTGKLDTKIYLPKDKMNNIEKNLNEIYESFYYASNLTELLLYLEGKYSKIIAGGQKEGLVLDADSEKEILHRMLLEGIPFYIADKLKQKLKAYEESISEQPMLLAHPSAITNQDLINVIHSENINQLVKEDHTVLEYKIYQSINEYELFAQFKYLYMEGHFEDQSIKDESIRADFMLNFQCEYFKNSRHSQINEAANAIKYLPYELNMKYPVLSLQVNDYVQCSYFRENLSHISRNYDSSFENDTGKKLTLMIVLFPEDLELSERKLTVHLLQQKNIDQKISIELKTPLNGILFKSRKLAYEIPKHKFPFIVLFYYMHGPVDKDTYSI